MILEKLGTGQMPLEAIVAIRAIEIMYDLLIAAGCPEEEFKDLSGIEYLNYCQAKLLPEI